MEMASLLKASPVINSLVRKKLLLRILLPLNYFTWDPDKSFTLPVCLKVDDYHWFWFSWVLSIGFHSLSQSCNTSLRTEFILTVNNGSRKKVISGMTCWRRTYIMTRKARNKRRMMLLKSFNLFLILITSHSSYLLHNNYKSHTHLNSSQSVKCVRHTKGLERDNHILMRIQVLMAEVQGSEEVKV